MNKSIILIICCIAIVFLGLIGIMIQHETAHKTFFKYYGVHSEIHLYWFGLAGGFTTPNVTDLRQISEEDNRVLDMLHSINEIYWYPFFMMYIMISFFFILCLSFFIRNWNEVKEISQNKCSGN